jgi:hypothetical protein
MNPTAAGAVRPGPLNPLLADEREYPFVRLERRVRELAPADRPLIAFRAIPRPRASPSCARQSPAGTGAVTA